MKKLLRCFWGGILIMLGVVLFYGNNTLVQASLNAPYIKFGDINFDGVIDEKDTDLIQQHIAAVKSNEVYEKHPEWYLRNKEFRAADVNGDQKIDVTDLLLVLQHMATISDIVTVTLMDEEKTTVYDCFPVIYDLSDVSNNFYPKLYQPTKSGYIFQGWYSGASPNGTSVESYGSLESHDDHILYARWKAVENKKYRVKFETNGGTCKTKTKKVTYGKTYGTLPRPARKGYTFMGWYTKKDDGIMITAGTKVTESEDHVLYAHWTASTKVTLNKIAVTLCPKQTYQLKATVTGKKGTVKWTSSNKKVVSVDSKGKITAKKQEQPILQLL